MEEKYTYIMTSASENLKDLIYTYLARNFDRYEQYPVLVADTKMSIVSRKEMVFMWILKNLDCLFAQMNPFLATKINKKIREYDSWLDVDVWDMFDYFEEDLTEITLKQVESFVESEMSEMYESHGENLYNQSYHLEQIYSI